MSFKALCFSSMVLLVPPSLSWAGSASEANGLYNAGQYEAAYEIALPLAEQGDAEAQYIVGSVYGSGLGGKPKDLEMAASWLMKAAQQRHRDAEYWVGFAYMHGLGVERDFDEAKMWFRRAADQEHPRAFHNLAALAIGEFSAINFVLNNSAREEALSWFAKGAKQGDFLSQYGAGILYWVQSRGSKDDIQAYYWMSRAANYDLSSEDPALLQFKEEAKKALEKYNTSMSSAVIAEAKRLLAK